MTTRYLALLAFLLLSLSLVRAANPSPVPVLEIGGARFAIPANWTAVPPEPASPARIGQWNLPQGAQAVAFYFGEGKGGEVAANLDTLAKLMTTATGGPAPRVDEGGLETPDKTEKASWFACYGIYVGDPLRSGIPALPKPNWGLIGWVAEFPGGPVYFRITGPAEAIKALSPKVNGLLYPFIPNAAKVLPGKSKEATK